MKKYMERKFFISRDKQRAENNHWEYSVSIFQKAINTFCSTKLSALKNSCLSLGKNKQQNIRMSFAILSEPSQEVPQSRSSGMDAGKETLFALRMAMKAVANKEKNKDKP